MLVRWVKEADSDDGHVFRGNRKSPSEQEEIRTLKKPYKTVLNGARHIK